MGTSKCLILTCVLVALCACETRVRAQEATKGRAGEKIDQAVGRIEEGAKDIADQFRQGFEKIRQWVDHMSVAARVYARLRWDKSLTDASVSVDVGQDGAASRPSKKPRNWPKARWA
jgi:hypothetical protein